NVGGAAGAPRRRLGGPGRSTSVASNRPDWLLGCWGGCGATGRPPVRAAGNARCRLLPAPRGLSECSPVLPVLTTVRRVFSPCRGAHALGSNHTTSGLARFLWCWARATARTAAIVASIEALLWSLLSFQPRWVLMPEVALMWAAKTGSPLWVRRPSRASW